MALDMRKEKSMKNWKKIMAMVCTAAMISGAQLLYGQLMITETAAEAAEETAE